MERFELFHLALPIQGNDMFSDPHMDREAFLRLKFSKKYEFQYRGKDYHYVPLPNENQNKIISRIGKTRKVTENKAPEDGFEDVERDGWLASILIIDPTSHEFGQRIAFQVDKDVGNCYPLLNQFIKMLNEIDKPNKFEIILSPLTQEEKIKNFLKKNSGKVTSITFEFTTPNMLGGSEALDKDLRDYREKERAKKVIVTLQNSDGLNSESDKIDQSIDYAVKTGSKIKARAGKGKSFISTDYKLISKLMLKKGQQLIQEVKNNIQQVLGNE